MLYGYTAGAGLTLAGDYDDNLAFPSVVHTSKGKSVALLFTIYTRCQWLLSLEIFNVY